MNDRVMYTFLVGNCLPGCGSLLAFVYEKEKMRARIVMELVLNKQYYLNDSCAGLQDISLFRAQYSNHFLGEVLTKSAVSRIFGLEVMSVCRPCTYMGLGQLLALASVMGLRQLLALASVMGLWQLLALSSVMGLGTADGEHNAFLPGIMWTHYEGKNLPASRWRPNHFVLCLPQNDDVRHESILKAGDFVLVGVPTDRRMVEYVAQISKSTMDGFWGVYLKNVGEGKWKWPDKTIEFFFYHAMKF